MGPHDLIDETRGARETKDGSDEPPVHRHDSRKGCRRRFLRVTPTTCSLEIRVLPLTGPLQAGTCRVISHATSHPFEANDDARSLMCACCRSRKRGYRHLISDGRCFT